MKILRNVIIVVLIVDAFLFASKIYLDKQIKQLDQTINEKEILIDNNNTQVDLLSSSIDSAIEDSELVQKEYEVWIHQNEKLEKLLH